MNNRKESQGKVNKQNIELHDDIEDIKEEKITLQEIFTKATTPDANWNKSNFKQFPDVVFFIRQLIGLSMGILFGFSSTIGVLGVPIFLVVNCIIPFLYYARYINVDIDDFGATELGSAGFQSSFGLFILGWTIMYSALNF
jgi:hypothetical protein